MAQIVDIDRWLAAPKGIDRLAEIERDLEADLADPVAEVTETVPKMRPDRPRRPLPWDGRRD